MNEAPIIVRVVVQKPDHPKKVWRLKAQQRSFAQVVKNDSELFSQKKSDVSTVCIRVKVDYTKWLEDCYVGKFFETNNAQSIKESFIMSGFNFVRLSQLLKTKWFDGIF